MQLLAGKRGLVTGITNDKSLAYACAKALRHQGAELAITYLNEKARPDVEPLARELSAEIFVRLDVQAPGSMEGVFDDITLKWGHLDFLVHSIAFVRRSDLRGRIVDCSRDGFLDAMDVSCHSFIRMARLAEPLMSNGGTLFTIDFYRAGEIEGQYNLARPVNAAMEATAKYLAAELWETRIRVFLISPGPFKTREVSGNKPVDELLDDAARRVSSDLLITTDDVGSAIATLASDGVSVVTGQTIYVDNGRHASI